MQRAPFPTNGAVLASFLVGFGFALGFLVNNLVGRYNLRRQQQQQPKNAIPAAFTNNVDGKAAQKTRSRSNSDKEAIWVMEMSKSPEPLRSRSCSKSDIDTPPFTQPSSPYSASSSCASFKKRNSERNLDLLHEILPPATVESLKEGTAVLPQKYNDVSVFFSDLVGFTEIAQALPDIAVMILLNSLYEVMDHCLLKFPLLLKVETIGDSMMVVAGLKKKKDAKRGMHQLASFALDVQAAVAVIVSPLDGSSLKLRIGIHSGCAMGGMVGDLMPRWCLFGVVVNTASRMESTCLENKIQMSEQATLLLQQSQEQDAIDEEDEEHHPFIEEQEHQPRINFHPFKIDERGMLDIKGVGRVRTFWLRSNSQISASRIIRVKQSTENLLVTPFTHPSISRYLGTQKAMPKSAAAASAEEEESAYSAASSESLLASSSSESTTKMDAHAPPTQGLRRQDSSKSNDTHQKLSSVDFTIFGMRRSQTLGLVLINDLVRKGNITSASSPVTRAHESGVSTSILLVEDSVVQRKLIKRRLLEVAAHLHEQWEITTANTGEEALLILEERKMHFDVIVIDQVLSHNGLYGSQVVEKLREELRLLDVFVIGITNNSLKYSKTMMASGVNYVWKKPIGSVSDVCERLVAGSSQPRIHWRENDSPVVHPNRLD